MYQTKDARVKLVKIAFVLFPVLIIIRLFIIQVVNHSSYKVLAKNQQIREFNLEAPRGNIYFLDGSPFAINRDSYFLIAQPIFSKDTISLEKVRQLLKIARPEVYTKDEGSELIAKEEQLLQEFKKDNWYLPISRNITEKQKDEIEKLEIKGLLFNKENSRFYPESDLGLSVLGFVARDINGNPYGYNGIEGYYNGDLTGKTGLAVLESDGFGNPIIFGKQNYIEPMRGRDITLTIDRYIQHIVEQKLKESTEDFVAKSGTVIAVNPKTGEILAMASYKNNLLEIKDLKTETDEIDDYYNYAISSVFEPGSVIKPFTLSAALDLGLISPLTTFNDVGPVYYSTHKVENWANKHYGLQNMYDLLIHSNNIGAAWVSEKIGSQKLNYYLKSFGFGKKTEIDLEGEDSGTIRNYEEWREIDLATAAFGQGFSATPLQLIMGYSAIANGGVLLKPYLVKSIELTETGSNNKKEIYVGKSKEVSNVIKKETAETMVEMLEVAANVFKDQYPFSKKYKISGKTGTAEIFTDEGYNLDRTIATYIGFPTTHRNFVLLVEFAEPQTSVLANETALPCWMSIANDLASYLKIEPDYNL